MIAYFAIKQGEIYPKNIDVNQIVHAQEIEKEQDKNTLMDQADLNLYKEQLSALMIQQNPYLDSDLNLVKLAEKLGVSTHQLSYVINKGFNENFFQFINAYRVEKAKELLNNPKYDAYTILAIGYESGFNSKTTFNTTFKKITKITPTQYRNMRSNL